MAKQNITLQIADRSISLTVDADKEVFFRKAAKLLDNNVSRLMEQVREQDYRQLLNYSAVALLAEKLYLEDFLLHKQQQIDRRLSELNEISDQLLAQ